jgi:hypothetical protein
MKRRSIEPTYDSVSDGPQYEIRTTVNDRYVSRKEIPDPFVNHTVRVSLIDTIRGLLTGGLRVNVCISGATNRIVEDVLELDGQYLGMDSTRRDAFNAQMVAAAVAMDTNEARAVGMWAGTGGVG